jgi:hypothetical protein
MAGVTVPKEVAALGYQQLEMRKQIALRMMMRPKQRPPQNVGQGLASVGDSVSDAMRMQMLEQEAAAREAENLRLKRMEEERAALLAGGGV